MSAGVLRAYVQADAPLRRGLFDGFAAALKGLPAAEAARWARRAVGPELDYTSLMRLRRFTAASPLPAKERLRLAVLGGPTTAQLTQLLETFLSSEGIACEVYEGPYGLFRQEILTPGSGLDRFKPQVVFLAVDARDAGGSDDPAPWKALWAAASAKWGCSVIQNTFAPEPWAAEGHYALRRPDSLHSRLRRLNLALEREAPPFVTLHPIPSLVAEAGAAVWHDPRFYDEAKMPCAPECLVLYAHSVMSLARALAGKSKKVLVVDLDNTLWGGNVGDAGVGGLAFGQGSAEGEAHLRLQEFVKALRERGILLAACSKNDPEKAREPFLARPDMPLKLEDFAAFEANWGNKADNLRAVAKSLDLGLDSFVFVDDHPGERALIREFLPEVAVPDMPEDPSGFVAALCRHRYFETAALTGEDVARAAYYEQNAKRKASAAAHVDMDAFLSSLSMRAAVEPVTEVNIERVAQLVGKSNQFNLTTRRRAAAEIRELAAKPEWTTLAFSLRDAFGDNGLVCVLFLERLGKIALVDTWLMSCRVLQRGLERFALNEAARRAREAGCERLRGLYLPTEKNDLVKDHYAALGFRPAGEEGGGTAWELDLTTFAPLKTHITGS